MRTTPSRLPDVLQNPALWMLVRLKARGVVRKQLRRLGTPAGVIFALLGVLLFSLWLGSLFFGYGQPTRGPVDAELAVPIAQVLLAVMGVVTCASALNHRGLYLPREEIELLLSAPISRRDLVRYRMVVNGFRTLLGALILGLVARRWAPVPLFGFVGAALAIQTLPIAGQALSILAGDAENRLLARLPRRGLQLIALAGGAVLGLVLAGIVIGRDELELPFGALSGDGLMELLEHPAVRIAMVPLLPWARAAMAPDLVGFLPWCALCVAVMFGLFELTARLPVDFRELSLQTSADVARRLTRQRRGGASASATSASRRTVGWRVPWIFGRGPFGALAWRKLAGILRKARGTALTALVVLALLSLLTLGTSFGSPDTVLDDVLFIAVMGTMYLGGGLRFDFRDDLEHMEVIKSWPVPPTRAFLATILPEVLLVSVLVGLAVIGRVALEGSAPLLVLGVLCALPPLVLTWVALDNLVYLFAPVRYVPGQDGALQHSGRMMVLLLVRMAVLVFLSAGVVTAAVVTQLLSESLGLSAFASRSLAIAAGAIVLAMTDVGLVWLGGRMLWRFDFARDRG